MKENTKNNIKNMITLAGIVLMVFLSFQVWYSYETSYKITFIERVESQDARTAVIFQMRGEPGISPLGKSDLSNRTKGRVIVERDGEKIKTQDFTVDNRGEALQEENWEVHFYPAGVEIVLYDLSLRDARPEEADGTAAENDGDDMGKDEQNGKIQPEGSADNEAHSVREQGETILVYYEEGGFSGYSEEEILSEITARYDGQVSFLREENDRYYFQADGFEFSVADDFYMTDDYEEAYLNFGIEQFRHGHNRNMEFEKVANERGETYDIPVVDFHGRNVGEAESFCNACCDLVEQLQETVGFEQIGYFEGEDRRYFDLMPYLENYNRTELYNALYLAIERDSLEVWQKDGQDGGSLIENAEGNGSGETDGESPGQSAEEMPEVWKNYEADCFYRKKDGTELRMVGVDRAAGSSYYALLKAENGVITSVVNWDPYLGHGGGAKWIDFLEDEQIGFSCLSWDGGDRGRLYRTEDGGKTFEEITWPSGNKELPDGTLYNPFVMPYEVWEEDGKLKMSVSQGPNGDYYEDGVWVYGLYESEDRGENWTYLGVMEDEDTRE